MVFCGELVDVVADGGDDDAAAALPVVRVRENAGVHSVVAVVVDYEVGVVVAAAEEAVGA